MSDAIDTLAGIAPGSSLDALRRRKPITRDNAQASFDALFAPAGFGGVGASDRAAVAVFVASLHEDAASTAFYRAMLTGSPALLAALDAEVASAAGHGPYGSYPAGPLSVEDTPGPVFHVSAAGIGAMGAKLAAALDHTHMLVFHLRDSAPALLRTLEQAGWTADDIVTLSQLVAFLSFQIRAAAGLRALGASHKDAA